MGRQKSIPFPPSQQEGGGGPGHVFGRGDADGEVRSGIPSLPHPLSIMERGGEGYFGGRMQMGETPMIDPDSLLMLPFFSPASFRICSGEDGDEEMKPDGMRVPLFAVGLGGNLCAFSF
ncbi:hypothetical protein TNCV_4528831 [Trichonephila clavipes]|uniref:Uncharacterized protein n=1 Tax=Trichonephila inaurata madagascariensis TaxID=2747483 RepID=A0A8X7CD54_9ARAC|nr:hypothetical protein TNCV_4528831 [Trichonephila clavipes]GFY60559.1 hypothetical protein TNIN_64401 [Trichonephila inaurata madagascariensis]